MPEGRKKHERSLSWKKLKDSDRKLFLLLWLSTGGNIHKKDEARIGIAWVKELMPFRQNGWRSSTLEGMARSSKHFFVDKGCIVSKRMQAFGIRNRVLLEQFEQGAGEISVFFKKAAQPERVLYQRATKTVPRTPLSRWREVQKIEGVQDGGIQACGFDADMLDTASDDDGLDASDSERLGYSIPRNLECPDDSGSLLMCPDVALEDLERFSPGFGFASEEFFSLVEGSLVESRSPFNADGSECQDGSEELEALWVATQEPSFEAASPSPPSPPPKPNARYVCFWRYIFRWRKVLWS